MPDSTPASKQSDILTRIRSLNDQTPITTVTELAIALLDVLAQQSEKGPKQ